LDEAFRHQQNAEHDKALGKIRQALKLDPKNAVAHGMAATCACNLKKYAEGLAYGRQAIKLDPSVPWFYSITGGSAYENGDLDLAEKFFRKFMSFPAKDRPLAHLDRVKTHLHDIKGRVFKIVSGYDPTAIGPKRKDGYFCLACP